MSTVFIVYDERDLLDASYYVADILIDPNPPDYAVARAHFSFQDQGLTGFLWPSGEPSITELLERYKKNEIRAYTVLHRGPCANSPGADAGGLCCFGMAWAENFNSNSGAVVCDVSMAFSRKHAQHSVAATRVMLNHLFCSYDLSAAYGLIPSANRAAQIFAMKVGLSKSGQLPFGASWNGQPVDGVIFSITREKVRSLNNGPEEVGLGSAA